MLVQLLRSAPFLCSGYKTFGWAGLCCSFQLRSVPRKLWFLQLWSACSGHLKSEKKINTGDELEKKIYIKWQQQVSGDLPWPPAEMDRRKWRHGTRCYLLLCLICALLLRNNQSLVPVDVKEQNDDTVKTNCHLSESHLQQSPDITLSIVSKMVFAAARPEAKASKQGEACPRFIAAMRTPKNTWKIATLKLISCQRICTVWCIDYTYLNQTSRRELFGVDDQLGPVPKGQSKAKENDAPQVSLENSNDGAFFDTPALSLCKVFVIPVKNVRVIFYRWRNEPSTAAKTWWTTTPVSFLCLPSKRSHCSDRWQDFISHSPCLRVGLQLPARQSRHSLQQQVPNTV